MKKYETKTLPSGIIIENRLIDWSPHYKSLLCIWYIPKTNFLHNEGAPATKHKNGDEYWLQNNLYHRLDGPAIVLTYGEYYHINGIKYSEKNYWKHPEVLKFKYLQEHPELEAFV